jgi:hypothetical protein
MNSYNDVDMTGNTSLQPSVDNSFLGWVTWFFFNRYMLIILILAFLGINLLSYFDSFVRKVVKLIRPLLAVFGYTIGETAKESVKIVKKGSKGVIDVAAGTVTGGINVLEKGLMGTNGKGSKGSINGKGSKGAIPNPFKKYENKNKPKRDTSSFPEPDEAGSRTQASKATSKAGYCYIGEDRGFRSCIQVSDSDTCMSGDIFPTQEICINPTLRQ